VSQAALLIAAAGLVAVAVGTIPFLVLGAMLLGYAYGPLTPASSHILSRRAPSHRVGLIFSIKQTGVPLGAALAGATVPALVLATDWQGAALVVAATCGAGALAVQPIRAQFDAQRDPRTPIRIAGLLGPLRIIVGLPHLHRLAWCSFMFCAMQMSLITFIVNHLTLNVGYTLVAAGLMLSVAQAGGVIGRVLWGAVADWTRWPERVLGCLGLGMVAAAILASQFEPDWPAWAVGAVCFLFGCTAVGWNGTYIARMVTLAPPGKASDASAGSSVFTHGGVLVVPPIFAMLVSSGTSYGSAYLMVAVLVLGASAWLLTRPR
jgi:predicted MFS family arabinose efflux permease